MIVVFKWFHSLGFFAKRNRPTEHALDVCFFIAAVVSDHIVNLLSGRFSFSWFYALAYVDYSVTFIIPYSFRFLFYNLNLPHCRQQHIFILFWVEFWSPCVVLIDFICRYLFTNLSISENTARRLFSEHYIYNCCPCMNPHPIQNIDTKE